MDLPSVNHVRRPVLPPLAGVLKTRPAPPAPVLPPVGAPVALDRLFGKGERDFLGPGGAPRLVPIQPFPASGKPMVFIHGIGGDPGNQEIMIREAQRSGRQVYVMAYDTWGHGGQDSAKGFAAELRKLSARGVRDLEVVAHSLGALTFKSTLNELTGPDGHLQGFDKLSYTALGAPWGGVSAANVSLYGFKGQESLAWIRDLAPESPYWKSMVGVPFAPEVAFHNIAGTWDQFIPLTIGSDMDANRKVILGQARRASTVPQGTHNAVNWDPRAVALIFDPLGAPDPTTIPGVPLQQHLWREALAMAGMREAFRPW